MLYLCAYSNWDYALPNDYIVFPLHAPQCHAKFNHATLNESRILHNMFFYDFYFHYFLYHNTGAYSNWGYARPNNYTGYQACASMSRGVSFKFDDEDCHLASGVGFVCEICT